MITREDVMAILADLDIEGLLSLGAPPDEYEAEARAIAERASRLGGVTAEAAVEIVQQVWSEYFGPFSSREVSLRYKAFAEAAMRIADCVAVKARD